MSRPNSIKGTERSKPVGIARSPNRNEEDRPQDEETAASRNPLTAYFSPGGLTPPPNIPPRIGSFSSRQGAFGNTGLSSSPYTGAGVLRPGLPATTNSGASTPIPGATGGGTDAAMAAALSDAPTGAGTPGSQGDRRASGAGTPVPTDLDHLTEEEKLRVLRKHLVSREERLGEGSQSRRPSTTAELQAGGRPRVANVVHFPSDDNQIAIEVPADTSGASIADEEDDFPIHYTAPGADITSVQSILPSYAASYADQYFLCSPVIAFINTNLMRDANTSVPDRLQKSLVSLLLPTLASNISMNLEALGETTWH